MSLLNTPLYNLPTLPPPDVDSAVEKNIIPLDSNTSTISSFSIYVCPASSNPLFPSFIEYIYPPSLAANITAPASSTAAHFSPDGKSFINVGVPVPASSYNLPSASADIIIFFTAKICSITLPNNVFV